MTRTEGTRTSSQNARAAGGEPQSGAYDFFVIGAFKYPQGDASAQRLLTLAQASAAAGMRPLVINDGNTHTPRTYRPGTIANARGVDYVCFASAHGGRVRRLAHRASRPMRLARTIRRLRSQEATIWTVVASGLCTPGVLLVLRLILRSTVIADVVERHDAAQFAQGRRAPYFVRHRFTSWLCGAAADRVIVISSKLARHYARMNPAPLLIPALVDVSEYHRTDQAMVGSGLTLLYMGNPTGKDSLGIVLDALAELPPSAQARLRFVIAGCDRSELGASPDVGQERLDRLGNMVEAHGFMPRPQLLRLLQEADFTVLIRPTGGYADAGFPTKVPESLAAGCPVLGNLTSDLGDYLVDGHNAVICEPAPGSRDVSTSTVREAVLRTLALTDEERLRMREDARASAVRLSSVAWGPRLRQALEGAT
jgi:glycosyltransferase involved in cell wall biosynthesis